MYKSNAESFIGSVEKFPELYERQFRETVYRFVRTSHERLMQLTPVHSGLTVRNWIVTMSRPEGGYYEEEQSPPDPGRTGRKQGRTSDGKFSGMTGMTVGSEPRRPANEREARRTRASVDLSNHPYKNIFITNNAPFAWQVETGVLPPDPYKPRSKAMLEITFAELLGQADSEFFA